ncbi:glycosyl transferase family 90 [Lacipirellula sp.]|uniref:glycosyl transferase family 90 n=1 Tax=Lacipirellula sp. TaxID=2691419 RepID=UPI003D111F75
MDAQFGTTSADYCVHSDELRITPHDGYATRTKTVADMLRIAFSEFERPFPNSFRLVVHSTDKAPELLPTNASNEVHACCTVRTDTSRVIPVPDYIFMNWEEVGIFDYDEMCLEITQSSRRPVQVPKAFWIGAATTNRWRQRLLEIAKENPDLIEAIGMQWHRLPGETRSRPAGVFKSLPDHCDYRYLIDIEGYGYSGRLKMLFFSGRPVFVQDRSDVEYWHGGLVPFVNFIPVAQDLSDLVEKIEWANRNSSQCAEIAANAMKFAETSLTRSAAIRFLVSQLRRYLIQGG